MMDYSSQYEILEEDNDLRDELLSDGSAKDILLHLKPAISLGVHQRINNKIDREGNMHGMSEIMDAVRSFNCMPLFLKALCKTNQAHLAQKINPQYQPEQSVFVSRSYQQQQLPSYQQQLQQQLQPHQQQPPYQQQQTQQHQQQLPQQPPSYASSAFELSVAQTVDLENQKRTNQQMFSQQVNSNYGVSVQRPVDKEARMYQQPSTQCKSGVDISMANQADKQMHQQIAQQQSHLGTNTASVGGMLSNAASVDQVINNELVNPLPRRAAVGEPIIEIDYGDDDFWVEADMS